MSDFMLACCSCSLLEQEIRFSKRSQIPLNSITDRWTCVENLISRHREVTIRISSNQGNTRQGKETLWGMRSQEDIDCSFY